MSYKALYRKYRSQNFDELVGQEAIVKTLLNALKKGKISHAYLFSGPRGTGKTSVARLFAKALNCAEGVGHICNRCQSCLAISENKHPDVIEIDAASNSGVDEIRNLIEKVKYSPIEGQYKIYIIDEVHMMTTSAFNALLKTLEEPPSYVVFILCTTEPYKLLPTIISRCQRYEFKKIDEKDLTKLIKNVLSKEDINADEDSIRLVVELANGGARDALSLLDQIIAYSGNNIVSQDIEKIFGLTSATEKITLLKYIHANDTLNVLNKYQNFIARNVDVSRLVNELLNVLKDALIYLKTNNLELLTSTSLNSVKELASFLNESEINSYIDLLMECNKEFKISNNPLFTFEIYLLKLSSLNNSKPEITKKEVVKEVINKQPQKEIIEEKVEIAPKQEVKKTVVKPAILQKNPAEVDLKKINLDSSGLSNFISDDNLIKLLSIAKKDLRTKIASLWPNLENYLDDKKYGPFATILMDSSLFAVTDKHIIIVNNYDIATKKVNVCKNQNSFSELIDKISGYKLFIYSLNRVRYIDIKSKFLNLQQVNKLPVCEDIDEIEITTEEIE
ncbi:MAG: DNA polymerase III subunit gamma/tau [Candidatus Onthovivens sp.]|nr:DNA polymerase III subunit gamma/tau [Candidatus Onthovivens sp.]